MTAVIISRSRRANLHVSAATLTMRFTAILIPSSSFGSAKCRIALTISSTTVPAAVLMRCFAPVLVNAARSVCCRQIASLRVLFSRMWWLIEENRESALSYRRPRLNKNGPNTRNVINFDTVWAMYAARTCLEAMLSPRNDGRLDGT